jgi:predicted nucleotidyltransferase
VTSLESIPLSVRADIQQLLWNRETESNVVILTAVESGSRAWGFARPESDYDVRFIYVRTPDEYMSPFVDKRKDTMGPYTYGDIDLVGWDLRKAMQLLAKSNPNLIEWLHSTILYDDVQILNHEDGTWKQQAAELAAEVFNPKSVFYHYSSLANNAMNRMRTTRKKIIKRELYAVRSILAARWVQKFGLIPPVRITPLLDAVLMPEQMAQEIEGVVLLRRKGEWDDEQGFSEKVVHWIDNEIIALHDSLPVSSTNSQKELVTNFFIKQVNIYQGSA